MATSGDACQTMNAVAASVNAGNAQTFTLDIDVLHVTA